MKRALLLVMLLLATLPWWPVSDYAITLLVYIGLASLVAMGLVLLTGVGGLTSFGQAAFVGLGAYTAAYFSTTLGLSPWLALPAALLLTGVSALLVGAMTVRMSGHFLPLATIAWGLSLYFLFGNLEFLGKYDGLSGLPVLSAFGVSFGDQRAMCVLVWGVVALAGLSIRNLLDSRPGRAIRALNGASNMAEAMGVNTARAKLVIFVYAALLAGLSGWLYAFVQRAVSPSPFGLNHGIEYLFMAVIGGIGHVGGAIAGAVVVTLLKEVAQHALPATWNTGGAIELIVFGVLMVAVLQRAPEGLWAWVVKWWPASRVSGRGGISAAAGPVHNSFRPDLTPVRPDPSTGSGQGSPEGESKGLHPSARGFDTSARTGGVEGAAGAGASFDRLRTIGNTGSARTESGSVQAVGSSPILHLQSARKQFGGLVAVDNISLEVHPGEIVGLIGPNGAGKSTTFNLITGVLPLTQGAVLFQGQPITGLPPRRIVAKGIARTFQHVQLVPGMSVLENVAIGAHLHGDGAADGGVLRSILRMNGKEEQRLLAQATRQLQRVGLGHELQREAGTLALGQQRLVEIARALCCEPSLLLLDEPAAGLRLQEKRQLATLLRELRNSGISVLLVEHDMDFVMNLTDRLVVMDFGTRIAHGTPAEVQRDPKVLEAYLGGVE